MIYCYRVYLALLVFVWGIIINQDHLLVEGFVCGIKQRCSFERRRLYQPQMRLLASAKKAASSSKPAATETNAVPEIVAEATTNHKNRNLDSQPARKEALTGVLHQIERSYGKGSILKLGESSSLNVECTSTGSLTFDLALGGGYPKGRVIEIYGPESSGKTTLALHAVAEVQKAGGTTAFIDAEHALDPVYAKSLGVKVEELFICQPDSGEMALDIVDQLVRSSAIDLIVVDSVAALVPRAELEGDMLDAQMGLQARLMSKALRKITGSLSKSHTSVIFLNQLRSKIGVFYGNPEVTAGGNALKFYSSVRVDIRRKEVLKDNMGISVRVKVVKNKVAPPFKQVEFDILFGSGIDKASCMIDAAETCGIIERKGSWYNYGEQKIGQGKKQVADELKANPKLAMEIEKKVYDILKNRLIKNKDFASMIGSSGVDDESRSITEFQEELGSDDMGSD